MAVLGRAGRWLVTTLILGCGILALLLALGAHLKLLDARELMASGSQAQATVTQVRAGGQRSSAHSFAYVFIAGGVKRGRSNVAIGWAEYSQLRAGETIAVRYAPGNPEKNITGPELADLESWGNRIFFPLAGLALCGWGIARILRRANAPA